MSMMNFPRLRPRSKPAAPLPLPAWRAGAVLNAWTPIANTGGYSGAHIDSWGQLVLITGTAKVVIAASGGHTDSSDNRVVSINLMDDVPAWMQQIATSATVTRNVPYNAIDGHPVSRHNYRHSHHIPSQNRIMLFGCRGYHEDGSDFQTVDAVVLGPDGTWAWDPAGTWANMSAGSFGMFKDPRNDTVWCPTGDRYNPATNSIAHLMNSFSSWRFPAAWDSSRNQAFFLQWADGQGFPPNGISASKFSPDTLSQTPITWSAASASTVALFQSDQPSYAGMDYDPDNDCFLFYAAFTWNPGNAITPQPGRIYRIKPNSGSVWDMDLFPLANGTVPDSPPITNLGTGSPGVNGRFIHVPALGGFVFAPKTGSNLAFLRTK